MITQKDILDHIREKSLSRKYNLITQGEKKMTKSNKKTLGSVLITKHLIPNRITLSKFAESIGVDFKDLEKTIVYQRPITMKLSKLMGDQLGEKDDHFFKLAEKD